MVKLQQIAKDLATERGVRVSLLVGVIRLDSGPGASWDGLKLAQARGLIERGLAPPSPASKSVGWLVSVPSYQLLSPNRAWVVARPQSPLRLAASGDYPRAY